MARTNKSEVVKSSKRGKSVAPLLESLASEIVERENLIAEPLESGEMITFEKSDYDVLKGFDTNAVGTIVRLINETKGMKFKVAGQKVKPEDKTNTTVTFTHKDGSETLYAGIAPVNERSSEE